jgi:choline-sulfatase
MPQQPNILVLMCDHHRFDALGAQGNRLAHTPNLDRLVAESVWFDACFTQSPVCAPARHSLATGQYAHAHGVLTNHHQPRPGMNTIAHALQPLGYRRINVGHMHWTDPEMDHGYEPWISHHGWLDTVPEEVRERYAWENQSVTRRTTGGPSPRTREQYAGRFVADQAIEQIEGAVAEGAPFLCWAAFPEPHPPFYPPREVYAQFDQAAIVPPVQAPPDAPPPHPYITRKQEEWAHLTDVEIRQILAGYYGLVELVDGYIERVLAALDRLGVRENTIVVWTSDHGEQLYEHRLFTKFCMYEASVHVPLLIHVPGQAPGVRSELVQHVDLFPTLCDLVGAEIPANVQGRSLTPLLESTPRPVAWRDAVFSQIADVQMIRTADWKLNVYDGRPGELYHLAHDPAEFYNLIDDPAQSETVSELWERLQAWERRSASD